MKKIVSVIGLLIFTAASVFAEFEVDLRAYGEFLNTKYNGPAKSEDMHFNNFGAEIQANIWIANAYFMDMGLSLGADLGGGLFTDNCTDKYREFNTAENESAEVSQTDPAASFGFSVAPAVQFNFLQKHSIFVAPGFRMAFAKLRKQEESATVTLSMPEFYAEAGYKFWILEKFAVNVGYKFELPLSILNGGNKIDLDSAFANKIYLGACFKLNK